MDPVTHGLTAWTFARTGGLSERGRRMTALFVAAGLFPDIDVVVHGGMETMLRYHRTVTHSLVGITLFAFVLAAVFWLRAPRLRFWYCYALAWLGQLVHIFLDFITSWGTVVFWPFSDARLSADWVFIVDLNFTGLVLLPVVIGFFWKTQRRAVARVFVTALVAYWGWCAVNHSRAVQFMRQMNPDEGAKRIAAFPWPLSPARWYGIVETNEEYQLALLDMLRPTKVIATEILPHRPKPEVPEEALDRAPGLKTFYWFTQFPQAERIKESGTGDGHGTNIEHWRIYDLAFSYNSPLRQRMLFELRESLPREDPTHRLFSYALDWDPATDRLDGRFEE
ncbi:MAG: metal-dependent hydrolase [bacterium]